MDKLHAGSTSPVAVTLQVRTWALSYASWIASEDVRPDDNSTFSRTLTYHATIPSPPSAPVVSFRTFEGSTPFGIILSIGAFVLNIRTAIACCRPMSSVAVRKSKLPKKGEREREKRKRKTAQGSRTNYCPTEFFPPSQTSCSHSDNRGTKITKTPQIRARKWSWRLPRQDSCWDVRKIGNRNCT